METATVGNPLAASGVTGFLESVLGTITYMALPIIALTIIYAGFSFITARGNREKLKKASHNITFVLIGAAIILGAYTIITVFYNTIIVGILGL